MATVGVIGAGVMGKDVALTCAAYGYDVLLCDSDADVLASAPGQMRRRVRKYRMMSPAVAEWHADDVLGRVSRTGDVADLAGADWIVENIVEDPEAKRELYLRLREVCTETVRVAVNTSCMPITRIASLMPHPQRVIGMHFMNPVPLIDGVEVIRGQHTSDDTVKAAEEFAGSLGKRPIVVNDMPGFVSNRLSHLFMNEAAFLVQDGVAAPEQVDDVFKLGYGHRMGPLETADLIGLDTVVNSLAVLYDEFQDPKFRCCPLLKKMVDAGFLGRKSGRGFYDYTTSTAGAR
ncbi:3-hydroxyacyl-CoA dehydrogenase family protein [Streptomyces lomondensis]|nr:3-hydroxyacyl-CoA dehydrogenase family protein [Streptomyces lomondensis]MCF0076972.1 3-hydroxyacyl-CoA dehydrogenase family protein [Streptomyces lomondensis]